MVFFLDVFSVFSPEKCVLFFLFFLRVFYLTLRIFPKAFCVLKPRKMLGCRVSFFFLFFLCFQEKENVFRKKQKKFLSNGLRLFLVLVF